MITQRYRHVIGGICGAVLASTGIAVAQDGDALLARAEQRVHAIDSVNRAYSGSFHQLVTLHSIFGADTVNIVDSFAVHVHEGIQNKRTSLRAKPPAHGMRMPPNSGNVFSLRNALFPYRVTQRARDVELSAMRLADTTIDGRPCGVIGFDYHVRSDSSHARGAGRLWIALDDATPVMSAYDFGGRHPRRGDFLSTVTVRIAPLGTSAVILRNDTRVRFSIAGQDIGHEETEVVNSLFASD